MQILGACLLSMPRASKFIEPMGTIQPKPKTNNEGRTILALAFGADDHGLGECSDDTLEDTCSYASQTHETTPKHVHQRVATPNKRVALNP